MPRRGRAAVAFATNSIAAGHVARTRVRNSHILFTGQNCRSASGEFVIFDYSISPAHGRFLADAAHADFHAYSTATDFTPQARPPANDLDVANMFCRQYQCRTSRHQFTVFITARRHEMFRSSPAFLAAAAFVAAQYVLPGRRFAAIDTERRPGGHTGFHCRGPCQPLTSPRLFQPLL